MMTDEQIMEGLFAEAAKKSGKYDAMVCFSGGKDSTYLLWLLKNVYGLNVLAFTVTHPFMRLLALENIIKVPDKLGIDHMEFPVAPGLFKTFIGTGLDLWKSAELSEMTGCQLCGFFHKVIPLNIARDMQIPLLIHGEDPTQVAGEAFPKNRPPAFSRLFRALFGEDIKGSPYDPFYAYNRAVQINPFCILDYDHRETRKKLKDLDLLSSEESSSLNTNCVAFHGFAKVALEVNGRFPYQGMVDYADKHDIATILDQITDSKKNMGCLDGCFVIEEYKHLLVDPEWECDLLPTQIKSDIAAGIKLIEGIENERTK